MKKVFKIIISLLLVSFCIYFFKIVTDLNLIPTKFYIVTIVITSILTILSIVFLFIKKTWTKVVSIILMIILFCIFIFGIFFCNKIISFFDKGFNNNLVETTTYDVIVLKNSNYNNIKDLNDKSIGYLSKNKSVNSNLKGSFNFKEYDSSINMYNDLSNNKIDSILINDAYLDIFNEHYKGFDDSIKVIYHFDKKKINTKKKEVKKVEPINILISGSDSRSYSIVNNSRSDVNMIMTINPTTRKVLLTSIPRDYYVKLHGTSGLNDKLTHSGIYGMDMTRETLEDVFNIKIDYTIKVGFNSVINLVNSIGGIDVYSDITFNSSHMKGWVVKQGTNHFNGEQALAFSRERYAYIEGDRHRVQNQQLVLEAIFNKVSSDKKLISKYDEILKALSDFYITDVPDSYVKLLVKKELTENGKWTVIKQKVDGEGAYLETYSMPGRKLYVMIPNQDTVNECSNQINKVILSE
ncbi:MAG: LCP family protein [Bacilli bacterium]|nr:LCP family protein [Bacilli bacterium]